MEKKVISWIATHDPKIMELEASICPEGFELHRATDEKNIEERHHLMEIADYILGGKVSGEEMEKYCKKVKLIQTWGIGYDKIDLNAAKAHGISVWNAMGSNSIPVAEMAMALILSCYRKIPYINRTVHEGLWIRNDMRAVCRMINGKTVGLVGIGNIARRVAKMISGFEPARILYYDIRPLPTEEEEKLGVHFSELDELCKVSDILSVHVPLTEKTRGMIDARRLALMKPTSIVINTARGGIVDETALYEALRDGKLLAAGLDSFVQEPINMDNPLLTLENVIMTSHCGGGVVDNVLNVTQHAFDNIVNFSRGLPPVNPADIVLDADGNYRKAE